MAHFIGETIKAYLLDEPGIIVKVILEDKQGTKIINTDEEWRLFSLIAWTQNTVKKTWALGYLEDVSLDDPSNEVLRTFATEDFGQPLIKQVDAESGEKPIVSHCGERIFRERIVPNLRWNKEPVTRILDIFRMTPEVFNIQNNTIRLDNQRLTPDVDISKYYAMKNQELVLDRRVGEFGFMVLYDLMRMSAGDISFEVESPSDAIMDIATTELLRDGKPRIGRGGSHYYSRYL